MRNMAQGGTESRRIPDTLSVAGSQETRNGQAVPTRIPFPASYQLIVTTTKGVYAWDERGITEIFRSGSEGIVAAKRFSYKHEMLAVADSQVVILHDVDKGMQRSYRLKRSEVLTYE